LLPSHCLPVRTRPKLTWGMSWRLGGQQAAGVIHTDFERGFIKAEVVAFEDFRSLCGGQNSMANIKAAGKYRQEGKTYVVQVGGYPG
jgi:ribosome-binding ATPase YchF (GTP1/OBG family)